MLRNAICEAMQRLLQTGAASQAEVDTAQNQFQIAEANVQLLQQKLSGRYSQQEVGHVEAQQAEARASLAAAQELLKNSNIVAPRAGMVYSLPVRQGAFVNPGDLLVQVADLHKVRVRAFVDEPEIGKLRKGQLVEVTWDAIPGRVWQGTLETLPTTVVQRGTRMVGEVTCVVENSDLKLLPNTNISVAVVIARQQNALTVPARSRASGRQRSIRIPGGKWRVAATRRENLSRQPHPNPSHQRPHRQRGAGVGSHQHAVPARGDAGENR